MAVLRFTVYSVKERPRTSRLCFIFYSYAFLIWIIRNAISSVHDVVIVIWCGLVNCDATRIPNRITNESEPSYHCDPAFVFLTRDMQYIARPRRSLHFDGIMTWNVLKIRVFYGRKSASCRMHRPRKYMVFNGVHSTSSFVFFFYLLLCDMWDRVQHDIVDCKPLTRYLMRQMGNLLSLGTKR